MVDWLAGKRIKGTSTERTASFIPSVGGWVELGRTTLGSAGDIISVASLANKRYYMILADQRASGSTNQGFRLNGDVTSTYAQRGNFNGTENLLAPSSTLMGNWGSAVTTNAFHVGYLANKSDKEKLAIIHNVTQNAVGVEIAPSRQEGVGKHVQTSVAINAVSLTNTDAGDYISGSELVVLGYDPADTHSTNFWTELASADLSGGIVDTGVFTAKKYLWVQGWVKTATVTGGFNTMFVGNTTVDKSVVYSHRSSINGAGDEPIISQSIYGLYRLIGQGNSNSNEMTFINCFIINNSAKEKLFISHANFSTSGIAPNRTEGVAKWANTSAQINRITFEYVGSGSFSSGQIKVWGSD